MVAEATQTALAFFGQVWLAARQMGPLAAVATELQPGCTTLKNSLLPNRNQQTMLRKALESAGFLVFQSDADRDRVRLRQLWATVNLLDIRTPRIRGWRSAGCDSAELIVMTHGSIAEALTAMQLRAAKILAVPLTSEAVRAAIDQLLIPMARSRAGSASPPIFVAVEPTITDLLRAKNALDRRNFDEAERLVRSAINRHPDSAMAHNLLGVLHLRLGDNPAAYHSFEAALRAEWAYESVIEKLGTGDADR